MSLDHFDSWLQQAGYKYHCFISYPRIRQNPRMSDCALRIKNAIEEQLTLLVPQPEVFLDTRMMGGTEWEKELKHALCHSLAMVALCSPIYYNSSHEWCGREWAAMDGLGKKRIPQGGICNIIPLIVKETSLLPDPVARIQFINITGVFAIGDSYYSRKEFRKCIVDIVEMIGKIASAVAANQASTSCQDFVFPDSSAFSGAAQPDQDRFPWRKK